MSGEWNELECWRRLALGRGVILARARISEDPGLAPDDKATAKYIALMAKDRLRALGIDAMGGDLVPPGGTDL